MDDDKKTLEKFAFRAFSKVVYIHLPDYKYRHKPVDDPGDEFFVGREKVSEQLFSFLERGQENGAYLVTGFRGMGKTSVVKKTIKQYSNTNKRKIKTINISFGQKELKELDILRQILSELKVKFEENGFVRLFNYFNYKFVVFFTFALFLLLLGPFNNLMPFVIDMQSDVVIGVLILLIIATAISSIFFIFIEFLVNFFIKRILIYKKINEAYDRCSSQLTKESGTGSGSDHFPFGFTQRQVKSYPIANPKEISNELIHIIKEIKDKLKWKLIFTFDELDKVESSTGNVSFYEDMEQLVSRDKTASSLNYIRERKELVIEILASLKYLITEAPARFIFIAGSEMFDAALADIADRQSAISSIFNQVINVESLLKDKSKSFEEGIGVTSLVEDYLERIILAGKSTSEERKNNKNKPFLKKLYEEMGYRGMEKEDILKVIFTLQHFIIYVTYRSNGSPKKMIKFIEDHCFTLDWDDKVSDHKNIYFVKSGQKKPSKSGKRLFLRIGYTDQYKIGLYNYIYRPVIASKSRTMKQYSDSLLVATPFLMDHLLKFHPFAFSLEDLELLPEILSANRSPELRFFLEEMVQWYTQYLVRPTDSHFYGYKFYYKIYNEIAYISKISEIESAAFNFTLDENYQVKLFLRVKIKELRSIYKDFGGDQQGHPISSIALLNIMLGDSCYYDQEYSDAVVSYADAFRSIRFDNLIDIKPASKKLLLAMGVRSLMKLALTYEKMKSYELAFGAYLDVLSIIEDVNGIGSKDSGKLDSQVLESPLMRYYYNALLAAYFLLEKDSALGEIKSNCMSSSNIGKIPSYFFGNLAVLCYFRGQTKVMPSIIQYLFNNIPALSKNKEEGKPWEKDIVFLLNERALINILQRDGINNFDFKIFTWEGLKEIAKGTGVKLNEEQVSSPELTSTELIQCGKILGKVGDLIFSHFKPEKREFENHIKSIFTGCNNADGKDSKELIEKLLTSIMNKPSDEREDLHWILCLYLLSARMLLKGGDNSLASYQYNKILLILRKLNVVLEQGVEDFIRDSLVKRMLEIASWNSGSSDRNQVYKYKYIEDINSIFHPNGYARYNYLNISNGSDLKEALFSFAALKTKSTENNTSINSLADYERLPEQALINQVNLPTTQFTRLNELSLQCRINKMLLESVFKDHNLDAWNKTYYQRSKKVNNFDLDDVAVIDFFYREINCDDAKWNEFPYLIANWVFCLHNMLYIMRMMEPSFLISHSNIADIHRRYGDVLKYYELCRWLKRKFPNIKNIDDLLNDLGGVKAHGAIDSTSEYQLALRHYYAARNVHERGSAYQYFITNMYYLEDDFNDPYFHFSIAFERQRIISEEINEKIKALRKEVQDSQLFNYGSYVNTDPLNFENVEKQSPTSS